MIGPNSDKGQIPRPGQFSPGGPKPLMGVVEVTNRCNMACPICYADAKNTAPDVSLADIGLRLRRLLAVTKTPIPIQISGGEPSLRKDLPEIVAMAKAMGYRNIELITNGIRIGEDATLLKNLKRRGLSAVYLQFDGLRSETTRKIRGRDMTATHRRAVAVIRSTGLCCTLAVVVTRGVNEKEIGDIVRYGIENIDVVRAINFQSAARFRGRFEFGQGYRGYGMPELLQRIESETGVPAATFLSEHLGHPACNAMSPVFVVNGRLVPLFHYIGNDDLRRFLGQDRREKILAAFAGKSDFFFRHLLSPKGGRLLAKAAPIFGKNPYNLLRSDHLLLFAKSFMEKESLSAQRMQQCCYAVSAAEGVFSFCAYNNLHRFDQRESENETIS